jgi:hypothetical protein
MFLNKVHQSGMLDLDMIAAIAELANTPSPRMSAL